VDRSTSPWDDQPRRASHQDKRRALQRQLIRAEIEAVVPGRADEAEIRSLLGRVLHLAGRYDFAGGPHAGPDQGCATAPSPPLSSPLSSNS
jgi:hypothetical protein